MTLYDNTQSFSPYFFSYIRNLARHLFRKYRLRDKRIVEVGCGKGQFLEMLYDMGAKRARGFDPAYVSYNPKIDKLVVRKYFNRKNIGKKVDFIICRHTLEHIPRPREFVESVSRCLTREGVMYFEVPDLSWIIKNKTFFDFTYEHCNYFTPRSLYNLFAQFGFLHIVFRSGLGGQYIQAEISRGIPSGRGLHLVDFAKIGKFIGSSMSRTKMLLCRIGKFVVWGAGGKGVLFLNRLRIKPKVSPYIIDLNPNKQGKYVPGTAQKVVAPDALHRGKVKTIIIMNPVYEKEIRKRVKRSGFNGKFIVL